VNDPGHGGRQERRSWALSIEHRDAGWLRRPRPILGGGSTPASQDLPCLAEVGFRPRQLFDTETAGRLLGYPRVALGTLVEEVIGFHLEKGHSAADWPVRPLGEEVLRYAALDVEVLIELRDALAAEPLSSVRPNGPARSSRQCSPPSRPRPDRIPGGAPRPSIGSSPAAGWRW
jgi:hypothetical protein